MNELPAPLTPADCDLQDFPFMPLDVARLRDSDLASDESPESCWAAVLLWSASWHQVPAGSIPDNDKWMAKQAGYAQRGKIDRDWGKVRGGALRNWVKCSDGRLYHPVVAEKALDAWQAKLEQRWRSECGRIKKHNQRHGTKIATPEFVAWTEAGRPVGQPLHVPEDKPNKLEDIPEDSASKGEGEGQGQGQGQGQGDLSKPKASVPNGTGAPAPPGLSANEALFQIAVPWLVANGCKESGVRSLLGGAIKQIGAESAWDLASTCMREKPMEPTVWLAAGLNDRIKILTGNGSKSYSKPEKFDPVAHVNRNRVHA